MRIWILEYLSRIGFNRMIGRKERNRWITYELLPKHFLRELGGVHLFKCGEFLFLNFIKY